MVDSSGVRAGGPYLLVIVCAILLGFGLNLRIAGLFACPAHGYAGGAFVADCRAGAFGDYDHGAFWYELEPQAWRSAAEADVLLLGNSRLQFGLSTRTAESWFESRSIRHFLFGFSDTETTAFFRPLLERMQPRAKVYVINVDRIFDDRVSRPAKELLVNDTAVKWRHWLKRAWQSPHERACGARSWLCGQQTAVFRSTATGAWRSYGESFDAARPVSDVQSIDEERLSRDLKLASQFIAGLPVPRDCVVLTIVPSGGTLRLEAEAIASRLGLPLIAPDIADLRTFDGSHLNAESAERWSAAFLGAAASRLQACLNR